MRIVHESSALDHPELRTERLVLREWRDEDLEPFAALNAESEVMRFMPKLLSRDERETMMQRNHRATRQFRNATLLTTYALRESNQTVMPTRGGSLDG